MQYKYVKKLENEKLIKDFEKIVHFKFDDYFIDFIKENNGGRPSKKTFYTKNGEEIIVKTFLSFNKNDKENIWNILLWKEITFNGKYIPFAIDNFGNIICFYKKDSSIFFIEIETGNIEKVASNFKDFISNLEG